jgi:hypothetical protein
MPWQQGFVGQFTAELNINSVQAGFQPRIPLM